MNKVLDLSELKNQADENGFVELSVFCKAIFKFKPEIIASYFDEDDRFYNDDHVLKARENIRHNITFEEKPLKRINPNTPEITTYKIYKGGIYKDDLEGFVEKIKISIEENRSNFKQVYEDYRQKRNEDAYKNLENLDQLKTQAEKSIWRKFFGK